VSRPFLCLLLLLFATDARALVIDRAAIGVDPAHTDTVTLGGRFESLSFAKLETLQIVLDGFAYDVPVAQITFKKTSFKYTTKKGQPGIRTLSVDLKKRRFRPGDARLLRRARWAPVQHDEGEERIHGGEAGGARRRASAR
jgi:hypothetical protein